MRKLTALVALGLFLVGLAGCGTSDDDSRCERVPHDRLKTLVHHGRIQPIKAAAVRSKSFKHAYMVAVKFKLKDDNNGMTQYGVWTTSTLHDDSDGYLSVDRTAERNSIWGSSHRGGAIDVKPTDDGVRQARDCVGE